MNYYLDIEILADRWEEEQRVIQELNEEEFKNVKD
jgi:hypothetical protein